MYLSIENTPTFSLRGKYIWNHLLMGNSFINDTFFNFRRVCERFRFKLSFLLYYTTLLCLNPK